MIDNILISLSFVFLVRNMNSNEINDLTFKSDRLLESDIDSRIFAGRRAVFDEQLSHDRSRDRVFAASLGRRMASRETSGAICRGGCRGARSSRDERQLSRFRVGVVSSANAAGPSGLRLRDGRVFEPQVGACDL